MITLYLGGDIGHSDRGEECGTGMERKPVKDALSNTFLLWEKELNPIAKF